MSRSVSFWGLFLAQKCWWCRLKYFITLGCVQLQIQITNCPLRSVKSKIVCRGREFVNAVGSNFHICEYSSLWPLTLQTLKTCWRVVRTLTCLQLHWRHQVLTRTLHWALLLRVIPLPPAAQSLMIWMVSGTAGTESVDLLWEKN